MAPTPFASGTKTTTIGTFTVTIATPAVFTLSGHTLSNGDKVVLSTTGTLPTGLVAGTTYFVVNSGTDGANNFRLSSTEGGSAINTSVSQSGTHSLVAEQFLSNINVAGTFTFHVDPFNMADGDTVELRVYSMILTGGTSRGTYYVPLMDAQPADDMIKIGQPLGNDLTDAQSLRFSIRQTTGTARAFPWKVLNYG